LLLKKGNFGGDREVKRQQSLLPRVEQTRDRVGGQLGMAFGGCVEGRGEKNAAPRKSAKFGASKEVALGEEKTKKICTGRI